MALLVIGMIYFIFKAHRNSRMRRHRWIDGSGAGASKKNESRGFSRIVGELAVLTGWAREEILRCTIEEIIFFWETGFRYDYERRGWKFDNAITTSEAQSKRDELKALYPEGFSGN